MSSNSDIQREFFAPALGLALLGWSEHVFKPYLALREAGLVKPQTVGTPPPPLVSEGRGPDLSKRLRHPVFLPQTPDNYDSVVEFDHMSEDYDEALRPFVGPVFDETFALMKPFLSDGARILDPSSGPGANAIELAKALPDGEVVAADLSRGMVETAHRRAREAGCDNMAFFQADVVSPPAELEGYFDAVFCCLSFHHYPDGAGAARAFHRVLTPGGKLFIADGGPAWFIALARPISVLGDPGFVCHRTGEEFREILAKAGFASVYWVEALPGIGVTIASR